LRRANTNPCVNAVNFYSRQSGDERHYARGMAQRLNVNLIEHERDKAVDLEILLHGPRTPRPILNFSACDNHPAILQIASCTSSTAVFDGEFGDNVFGATSKQEVLYEEVWRHGFGRMFANTAMDYAKLRGLSIWRALRLGFHERWTNHEPYYSVYLWDKRYRDKDSTSLVCHDALVAYEMTMERLIHPWLANIDDLPAGKFLLVFGLLLLTSSDYHSALAAAGGPDVIAPLISQPLVEVALRVPSRFTIHEGQDRAVARLAFQDELTDAVLNRGTGKGTPLLWVRDTIERNRPFLRAVLLDGILVKERILDRKKLEALLTGDINKSLVNVSDIFIELYIEAWLRQWTQEGYTPIDHIAPSFLLENHPTIEGR
jgi:asparagine synthase (glutamine-hydrolysing)